MWITNLKSSIRDIICSGWFDSSSIYLASTFEEVEEKRENLIKSWAQKPSKSASLSSIHHWCELQQLTTVSMPSSSPLICFLRREIRQHGSVIVHNDNDGEYWRGRRCSDATIIFSLLCGFVAFEVLLCLWNLYSRALWSKSVSLKCCRWLGWDWWGGCGGAWLKASLPDDLGRWSEWRVKVR